jgi:hypothetical protein
MNLVELRTRGSNLSGRADDPKNARLVLAFSRYLLRPDRHDLPVPKQPVSNSWTPGVDSAALLAMLVAQGLQRSTAR